MIKSEIIRIASDYSSQYNSYPFDIFKLISDLNISVVEKDLKADGYFVNKNNIQRIYINKKLRSSRRKRFTLAHEVGHYVLHAEHPILKVEDSQNTFSFKKELKGVEDEANLFASELLSPSAQVIKLLPNSSLKMENIDVISNYFDISFTSAAIKCMENSKTMNEIFIVFDENDEYSWFSSGNDEWSSDDMPKNPLDVEEFCRRYFKKNTISTEKRENEKYGVLFLVSGILKDSYEY